MQKRNLFIGFCSIGLVAVVAVMVWWCAGAMITVHLPISENLRLRDNDFSRILAIAESIHVEGSVRLNPGNYAVDGAGTRIGVRSKSTVTLSATIRLSPRPAEDGRIVLAADYLDIEMSATEPISITTSSFPVTVSVTGLTAQGADEDQVASATFALRQSLTQTLLSHVLTDDVPDHQSHVDRMISSPKFSPGIERARGEGFMSSSRGR